MLELLTIEEENKVIDGFGDIEFYKVMRKEFGAAGMMTVLGYATIYGLTGKKTTVEAREALVGLGLSQRVVYNMYGEFRRLRRALLAARGLPMREQRGGPGMNAGVPPVIDRIQRLPQGLQSVM